MNLVVVGFGNMGCRHTESILKTFSNIKIWIVEPNTQNFYLNSEKIGASNHQLKRVNKIESINEKIDFAVIATSSSPRFEIVDLLLDLGVKKMLVEKIVFQSKKQFDLIINKAEKHNANIFCNFVSRYYPSYIKVKNYVDKRIFMNVIGADFGLACNALHYVDLFEYFTNEKSELTSHKIHENIKGNKRGNIYKEILGQISWTNSKGDKLFISANENHPCKCEITVQGDNFVHIINEESMTHTSCINGVIQNEKFNVLYSSLITGKIIKDIINDSSLLPKIEESYNYHIPFFKAVNKSLNISENKICPIT